jgi:tetratricopeptide (TPR) repeat protein
MPRLLNTIVSRLLVRRGMKLLARGLPDAAVDTLLRAAKYRSSIETDYALVLAYMGAAKYPEAEERLKTLPEGLFLEPTAGLIYGECLLRQRKWAEVETWFLALQEKLPNRPDLQAWIDLARDPARRERYVISREFAAEAQKCVDAGDFSRALKLLEDAIELTPDRAELHNNLGSVRLHLGVPHREILRHFEQAVRLEPDNRRYQTNLAYIRRKR